MPAILSQGEFAHQRTFALPGDLLGGRDWGWWYCWHLERSRGAAPPYRVHGTAPVPP